MCATNSCWQACTQVPCACQSLAVKLIFITAAVPVEHSKGVPSFAWPELHLAYTYLKTKETLNCQGLRRIWGEKKWGEKSLPSQGFLVQESSRGGLGFCPFTPVPLPSFGRRDQSQCVASRNVPHGWILPVAFVQVSDMPKYMFARLVLSAMTS